MRLNELYNTYKDQVEFLCIYTAEAHPEDGWRSQANIDEGIEYYEPTSDDERTDLASVCQVELGLEMPMLIDGIDNAVEDKYVTLPMRLFLVDANGDICYTGGRGPRDFDPDSWEAAIKEQIGG